MDKNKKDMETKTIFYGLLGFVLVLFGLVALDILVTNGSHGLLAIIIVLFSENALAIGGVLLGSSANELSQGVSKKRKSNKAKRIKSRPKICWSDAIGLLIVLLIILLIFLFLVFPAMCNSGVQALCGT